MRPNKKVKLLGSDGQSIPIHFHHPGPLAVANDHMMRSDNRDAEADDGTDAFLESSNSSNLIGNGGVVDSASSLLSRTSLLTLPSLPSTPSISLSLSSSFIQQVSNKLVEAESYSCGILNSAANRADVDRVDNIAPKHLLKRKELLSRRRSPRKRKPVNRYGGNESELNHLCAPNLLDEENKLPTRSKRQRRINNILTIEELDKEFRFQDVASDKCFPIKTLPAEVLLYIFSLTSVADVLSLSLVCRDFNLLANDSSIWKSLSCKKWKICDVLMYDHSWKRLYRDNNSKTQRGWFEYYIKDFTKKYHSNNPSMESFYSEPFTIGSHTWTILIFPRANTGPYLSLYLSVKGTTPKGNRESTFTFLLHNHKDPNKSIKRDSLYGHFVSDDSSDNDREDWGFTKFIELDKLLDPQQGFLVDDTLRLSVFVANLSELDYWISLLKSDEDATQLEAMNALVQSSYVDENKTKIVGCGGLVPIMKFLVSKCSTELQRSASDVLWNLTAEDSNKELVLDMGGVPQIIELLSSADIDVQRHVINICWNLSTVDKLKRKICEHGGIHCLVRLLSTTSVVDIQLSSVMVLWNLATLEEVKEKIVGAGAIVPVIQLLNSRNEDLLVNATSLLWNLAEEIENANKIIQEIKIDNLLPLLRHSNSELVKNTLYLLGSLADGNATFIFEVENRGGVNEIVNLLYSQHDELVGEAACTLSKFMYCHKIKNLPKPVIRRLLDLLSSDSEAVVEFAILALLKVALHETNKVTICDLGGLEVIIPLLSKKSFAIQGDASIIITNLATNPRNKEAIMKCNGLDALIPLLESDRYPKNFAACAIASLLEHSEGQRIIMTETGLNSLLQYLMNSLDYFEGPSHIAMALVNMNPCYRDEISLAIQRKNLVPFILNVIQQCAPENLVNIPPQSIQPVQSQHQFQSSFQQSNHVSLLPHIPICCPLNLLGYLCLIDYSISKQIQMLGGVQIIQMIIEKCNSASLADNKGTRSNCYSQILFLAHWALYLIQNGPSSLYDLPRGHYVATSFMKISSDRSQVRNDSCFLESVVRTGKKYPSCRGKYYYEVTWITWNGLATFGWATQKHHFHIAERKGVGDDSESWSYEPRRALKWHNSVPSCYGNVLPMKLPATSCTSITIGCALDLDGEGAMNFFVNGKDMGTAFSGFDTSRHFCPALSLTSGQQCLLNFGRYPFKSMPAGYEAFE